MLTSAESLPAQELATDFKNCVRIFNSPSNFFSALSIPRIVPKNKKSANTFLGFAIGQLYILEGFLRNPPVALNDRLGKALFDTAPIEYLPNRFDIIGTHIFILKIVRMLPHVDS